MGEFGAELITAMVDMIADMGSACLSYMTFGENDSVLTMMNVIWKYFCMFGMCLSIVYFIAEINKKYMFEARDLNFKSMSLPFLKLGFSIVSLCVASDILSYIVMWNTTVLNWAKNKVIPSNAFTLSSSSGDGQRMVNAMSDAIKSMGFLSTAFLILVLLFGWLVAIVVGIIFNYKAFLYKLEFAYRIAISPIAFADIYSGMSSNAVKWLKGFIALILYGMIMVTLPAVGTTMAVQCVSDAVNGMTAGSVGVLDMIQSFFMIVIAPIAELGILSTIKSMTKEVIGA